jgi:hypothetical protein
MLTRLASRRARRQRSSLDLRGESTRRQRDPTSKSRHEGVKVPAHNPDCQALLAYYDSAYGPTIRIDLHLMAELLAVRELFKRLASGEIAEDEMGRALGCRLDSIRSLIVRGAQHRPSKVLVLESYGSEGPVFCWSNTREDWLECAERVDPLVAKGSPGHQYMTTEGVDDALVELCYRE